MKKGARVAVMLIVIAALAAAAGLLALPRLRPGGARAVQVSRRGPAPAPEQFAVPVAVALAEAGPAREILPLYGSVYARREVGIFSSVSGKTKELRVQVGDRVARGQVLAVIDRDQAGLRFADAEATSTIDGVVKSVLTEVGATVSPAAPLFQVVDVQSVEVAVSVPEKRLGRLAEGLPAEIAVLAYPGRVFHGAVSRLSPTLDPASRTLEARIRVDNPGQALKPGMFAEVRLLLRQEQRIVRVPLAALVDRNGGKVAFVVEEGGRAREVAVRTAFVQDDTAAVESGINAGERVVVVGQQNLNDGDEVAVVEERK
jgi:multidrug efflux pump subunit AcrA (membrane-fusion protein)